MSLLFNRRETATVWVGNVPVGSNYPIAVQSMTNTDTADVDATVAQIAALVAAGSDIVRVTVNNNAAAAAVPIIVERLEAIGIFVPIVGDFHFNGHRLLAKHPACAMALAKYRINPGNVGGAHRDRNFRAIIRLAINYGKPVRIGVNWGSLDPFVTARLMDENGQLENPLPAEEVKIAAMVASAMESARVAEDEGLPHDRIILSTKISTILGVIDVYQRLAALSDYPLHVGLTEAGMAPDGIVSSAGALTVLLLQGIGDTIRVSLTPKPGGDRTEEVHICQKILQKLEIRFFAPSVSACPGCGRSTAPGVNSANPSATFYQEMAEEITEYLSEQNPIWHIQYPGSETLHVAIMGCVVNGPGESKEAHVGISLPGTSEKPIAPVYVDGELFATLAGQNIVEQFKAILANYVAQKWAHKS